MLRVMTYINGMFQLEQGDKQAELKTLEFYKTIKNDKAYNSKKLSIRHRSGIFLHPIADIKKIEHIWEGEINTNGKS